MGWGEHPWYYEGVYDKDKDKYKDKDKDKHKHKDSVSHAGEYDISALHLAALHGHTDTVERWVMMICSFKN